MSSIVCTALCGHCNVAPRPRRTLIRSIVYLYMARKTTLLYIYIKVNIICDFIIIQYKDKCCWTMAHPICSMHPFWDKIKSTLLDYLLYGYQIRFYFVGLTFRPRINQLLNSDTTWMMQNYRPWVSPISVPSHLVWVLQHLFWMFSLVYMQWIIPPHCFTKQDKKRALL